MNQNFLVECTTPHAAQAEIYLWFREQLALFSQTDQALFDRLIKLQTASVAAIDDAYDALTTAEKKRAGEIWLAWEFCTLQSMSKAQRNGIEKRQFSEDYAKHKYPGQTIKGSLQRAAQNGLTAEQLRKLLHSAIAISLTTHPNQPLPPPYVAARQKLAAPLQMGDRAASSAALQTLLKTSPTQLHKKMAEEDFDAVLDPAEQFFWQLIPLLREVQNTIDVLADLYPDRGYNSINVFDDLEIELIIRRMWSGFDRDGNPAITYEVSQYALVANRARIKKLYMQSLGSIKNVARQPTKIEGLIAEFAAGVFDYAQDCDLAKFRGRLTALKAQETGEALGLIYDLDELTKRFHWNLVIFQPRQEADIIAKGVALVAPHYATIKNEAPKLKALGEILDRLDRLTPKQLAVQQKRILDQLASDKGPLYDTIKSLELVRDNPDAFCDHIISNTQNASDVLELMVLLRLMGVEAKINIRPLCEARVHLENMPVMFETLVSNSHYRRFIKLHDGQILFMIALSDTERQDGSGVMPDQHLTPIFVVAKIVEVAEKIQNTCQKFSYFVHIMFGGGGSINRGGGDWTNYPFNFARNLVGHVSKIGKKVSDFAKHIGREFAFTLQHRQIEEHMGNPSSAYRFLERMIAMNINFGAFLNRELSYQEMLECVTQYEANLTARELEERAIIYFHHFRGPALDELSVAVIPSYATTLTNIGPRPDLRPKTNGADGETLDPRDVYTLKLTPTRAITNQNASELPGLEITGWLGARQLAEIPLVQRNWLIDHSPIFDERLNRLMISMARADIEEGWKFSAIRQMDAATTQNYAAAYDAAFQASLKRGEVEQFAYETEMPGILQKLGLKNTRENGWLVQMSWLEREFTLTQQALGETLLGQAWGQQVSARQLMGVFERLNAEETIKREMVKPMRHWLARLSEDFRWQPVRRDPTDPKECLLQQLAQNVSEGNRTPPAYTNRTPGQEFSIDSMRRALHHCFPAGRDFSADFEPAEHTGLMHYITKTNPWLQHGVRQDDYKTYPQPECQLILGPGLH